jgi:hypothetical protein
MLCTASGAAELDQEAAWQAYMRDKAGRQPVMNFPYQHCFRQAASEHELPLSLLLALARGESDFDPSARSHANAHGLMQILWPDTARELGIRRLSELYVPCKNVDAGARYLKGLMQRYQGNVHRALAAYNYGPGRIPLQGAGIPAGASWYSGYIFRHLGFVLGRDLEGASIASARDRDYLALGKATLIEFGAPYRAEAFTEQLAISAPEVRLDWFRVDARTFRVVVLFEDQEELGLARGQLGRAGVRLP